MYYKNDFATAPFQPRFGYRRSLGQLRQTKKFKKKLEPEVIIKHPDENEGENFKFLQKWLLNFCDNTSIHGVKYIGQSELHWFERMIWSSLVGLAIFSIIYISLELSEKFNSSPLSTVVESTIYPVSEIAYPAITICPNNRLNAQRCIEAESVFLPNASESALSVFRLLLASMNNLEFGALDEFYSEIFEYTSDELNQLNLTELYEYTMLSCEQIFTGNCWWRNKYYNCCDDFFVLQKSEYGICYSFNSAVNEIGLIKEANTSVHFPYRTSNYGDWSGLRVELSTRRDLSLKEELNGIKLQINHPNQWPNSANFVPAGSTTSIAIKPIYSYTTEDVRRLDPDQRQCLNDDESKSAMTLPELKYLQMNCISECRQQYLYKYCNCSVSSFYPIGDFRDCNFKDLKCLLKYNDIFNYEKPPADNPFFSDDDEGMACPCLPECNRVDYSIEITSNVLETSDNMTLDFHYQSANLVKYRTDTTFGWLDLLVSFGGIAGLFLGCSILSGVEIFYYIIIILVILMQKLKKRFDQYLEKHSRDFRVRDLQQQRKKTSKKGLDNVQTIKVISLADVDKSVKKF